MQRKYKMAQEASPSNLLKSLKVERVPFMQLAVRRGLAVVAGGLCLLGSHTSFATVTTGRFSFGGYISKENLANTGDTASANDFQTLSSRVFLSIRKLGDFDLTADLRDKHDFFDKLASERRSLTGGNEFQVRELNVRYPNSRNSFYSTLGRFSLPDAGSVYVDGLELGSRFGSTYQLGAFGGHNPKRPESSYMRNDTPDITYGTYLTYFSSDSGSPRFFNASHAFVTNSVEGFTDRQYFYSNLLYQRNARSRVISNIYLDFVPRTYVQNGNLLLQQGFTERVDGSLQLSAVDAIAYSRSRNVLETLPSSPYEDVALRLRYSAALREQWISELRYGKRGYDNKTRQEAKLGYFLGDLASSRVEITTYLGYHHEFVSAGPLLNFEMYYYSSSWEYGLNLQGAIETRMDGDTSAPSVLHPLIAEVSVGNVTNKVLFTTFSLEYAQNEIAQILSAFFKLTYRFGPVDLAPVRERTPQTGTL